MRSLVNHCGADGDNNDILCWRAWSAARRPTVAIVVAIFLLGLVIAVHIAYRNAIYPVMTFIVLAGAVCPYYLPTRFTVDQEGITVSSLLGKRKKLWRSLKAYFPDGDGGVLVSPLVRRSLLSMARGIYLPYANNRDRLLDYLRQHLPQGQVKEQK